VSALAVALAIIFCVLSFVAFKYPRGKADWGRDRAETASILGTALTFVLLFLLLWYASATADWPRAVTIAFWGAACATAFLIVAAILFPDGLRAIMGTGKRGRE
jgi:uncharacterized membrane protein